MNAQANVVQKVHARREAVKFGLEVADLAPSRATDDDLRRTMADPVKRKQITAALDEIIFAKQGTAPFDIGGRKAEARLVATIAYGPGGVEVMRTAADAQNGNGLPASNEKGAPFDPLSSSKAAPYAGDLDNVNYQLC